MSLPLADYIIESMKLLLYRAVIIALMTKGLGCHQVAQKIKLNCLRKFGAIYRCLYFQERVEETYCLFSCTVKRSSFIGWFSGMRVCLSLFLCPCYRSEVCDVRYFRINKPTIDHHWKFNKILAANYLQNQLRPTLNRECTEVVFGNNVGGSRQR